MNLPKIQHPTFKVTIPSTKKQMSFRPFLVKEEKILLMAKTSADNVDILSAIKQIVNNCCVEKNFNVEKLAIFDLEYVFLKIRANSVGNVIELTYRDAEDGKTYDFQVDLNSVEIKYPANADNKIPISDKVGLIMRYPSASLYDDKDFLSLGEDALFEVIYRCVDKIYENDTMYDASNYTKEQITEFLDGVDTKTFQKIQSFLGDAPRMEHVLTYVNSLKNERRIELTTLSDFFTLR